MKLALRNDSYFDIYVNYPGNYSLSRLISTSNILNLSFSEVIVVEIGLIYSYYCGTLCGYGSNMLQFVILDYDFKPVLILVDPGGFWIS